MLIEQLTMEVSPLDASYMPSSIVIYAGQTVGGLKEIKQCTIPSNVKEFPLVSGLTEVHMHMAFNMGGLPCDLSFCFTHT